MSNADRLAGYLADFKKENKSSVSISMGGGDDESETANLLGWASSGFDKLKNKVSKVQENIPIPNPLKSNGESSWASEAAEDPFCPSLSKKQRMLGFMGCMGMGVLCFSMALAYLPVLLISARKFALLYTLGSIFFISSFSLLYGPKKHFKHLISTERLPFTASYLLTMALTLYAAMGAKSYILTVIAAGLQMAALTYFTLSYIPGGQTAIKFMAKIFYAVFSRCFKSAMNV